jgi:vacuolar-type H+-ATPase subunit H
MAPASQPNRDEDTEQDISRVLEAEQRARQAIARCEQDAVALIAAARDRARQIQARTDARMSLLRSQIEQQSTEHATTWREQARILHARENDPDPRASALADALARLAAALTGGEP